MDASKLRNAEDPKARLYTRRKQLLTLTHLALTPALLLLAAGTPVSSAFKSWALEFASQPQLALALYFLFFSGFMLLFDLPFSYYSGFIVEHEFGLSNQTFAAWRKDFLKKSSLSFLFSLVLIELLYLLIWKFPAGWWLFAWAGYAVISYLIGKIFPVVIVPLFFKYERVPEGDLKTRIIKMSGRYGLPVENVYSLNLSRTTKKANAAFMGIGRTKRVVLSDTLLAHFNHDEIETVVAHEIGHFKNHDIFRQLAFGLVTSLVLFYLSFRMMDPAARQFGFEGVGDIASLPVLFLVLTLLGTILIPVQSAFSRMLERAADRFSLEAYPKLDIFISCMEKLARVNLSDPVPNPVYEWFFYDHPSISRRIRLAKERMA